MWQEHPGLGIAQEMGELLRRCALRVGLAGVLARPAYFHNAVGAHDFHFADPVAEGTFLALRELLAGMAERGAPASVAAGRDAASRPFAAGPMPVGSNVFTIACAARCR